MILSAITEMLDCVLCAALSPNGREEALVFSIEIVGSSHHKFREFWHLLARFSKARRNDRRFRQRAPVVVGFWIWPSPFHLMEKRCYYCSLRDLICPLHPSVRGSAGRMCRIDHSLEV